MFIFFNSKPTTKEGKIYASKKFKKEYKKYIKKLNNGTTVNNSKKRT